MSLDNKYTFLETAHRENYETNLDPALLATIDGYLVTSIKQVSNK